MQGLSLDMEKQVDKFCLQMKFHLPKGILGVFGPSGSGKTMLLKSIAGIVTPDRGQIHLEGRCLFDKEQGVEVKTAERKVGLLFQNYALFSNMTVKRNILMAAPKEEETVKKYMDLFQIGSLQDRYPSQISGGQRQRVALARMMASDSQIYLMDEPFSSLDKHLLFQIQDQLMAIIQSAGKIVLYVSHDIQEIYRYCDRMILIREGKILEEGEPLRVGQAPQKLESAKALGIKNIWPIGEEHLYSQEKIARPPRVRPGVTHLGIYGCHVEINTARAQVTGVIKKATHTPMGSHLEVECSHGGVLYVDTPRKFMPGEPVKLHLPGDKMLLLEE